MDKWRVFLIYRIINLGKSFSSPSGTSWALRGISLELPSKGLIAITGERKRQEHFAQLPLAFDETERRGNPLPQ
jgi:hypothetical protein